MKNEVLMWFLCKVEYMGMAENGMYKKMSEKYLIKALSFAQAEEYAVKTLCNDSTTDFKVSAVARKKISELFIDDDALYYYKVKVAFVTLDEKSGAEKKTRSLMIVKGDDITDAINNFKNGMKGTLSDYEIESIALEDLEDVFNSMEE